MEYWGLHICKLMYIIIILPTYSYLIIFYIIIYTRKNDFITNNYLNLSRLQHFCRNTISFTLFKKQGGAVTILLIT